MGISDASYDALKSAFDLSHTERSKPHPRTPSTRSRGKKRAASPNPSPRPTKQTVVLKLPPIVAAEAAKETNNTNTGVSTVPNPNNDATIP